MTAIPPADRDAPADLRWSLTTAVSALENWGHHHPWCESMSNPANGCNCGFTAQLASLRNSYEWWMRNATADLDDPAAVSPDAPEPRADDFDYLGEYGITREELERRIADVEAGNGIPHEQAMREVREELSRMSHSAAYSFHAVEQALPDNTLPKPDSAAAPRPAGPTPEIDALLDAFQQACEEYVYAPYPEKFVQRDTARESLRTALASARSALDAIATKLEVDPGEVLDEVDGLLTVASDRKAVIVNLESALSEATRREEAKDASLFQTFLAARGVDEPCERCGGMGTRTYGSTATWRGGIGGQAMTTDVCDRCWGSGDKYRHWPDRRAARSGEPTT